MLELLLFSLGGICAGFIFGIIPGLHPNTMVAFTPVLASIEPFGGMVFLVSMGVSNIMTDFVPSVLLGAPDSGSELAALPGQRMMMSGRGLVAIKLMVMGFVSSFVIFIALSPLLFLLVPSAFEISRPYIFAVLIFISCVMMMTEKRILAGIFIFFIAGGIGIASLNLPVNPSLVLFPMLAGFFGVPSLLIQIKKRCGIIEQSISSITIDKKDIAKSSFTGYLGGVLSGFLPGVGSSEIASMLSLKKNDESFMVAMGSIASSNFIMSLVAIWLIGKTRSGIAVAINNIYTLTSGDMLAVVSASLLSIGVTSVAIIKISKAFAGILSRINYSKISAVVVAVIFVMVVGLTGISGVLVLATCTALGLYAVLMNVKRGLMMAALIVPTILFFIGL